MRFSIQFFLNRNVLPERTSKAHPMVSELERDARDVNKQRQRGHYCYRRVAQFQLLFPHQRNQSRRPACTHPHRADRAMKDPSISNIAPKMTISNEVILSNQFISEEDPFAEYMWMENEEEFNRQVEEELWEEEFIERCFQEMLEEEEQWEWFIPSRDLPSAAVSQLQEQIGLLVLDADVHADTDRDVVMNSNLNPNAKEFTPGIQKHVM
uniref:Polyadenylate-binding protein-interacting protein 2 n=2 Tax=Salarias fasciatus TaxID=181472 RepID=A0A672GIN9_SALFA